MRTFKEVKDEQDHAIFQLGVHTASAEQWKCKVLALAIEADQVLALSELAEAQKAELGEENGQSKDSGGEIKEESGEAKEPREALTQ